MLPLPQLMSPLLRNVLVWVFTDFTGRLLSQTTQFQSLARYRRRWRCCCLQNAAGANGLSSCRLRRQRLGIFDLDLDHLIVFSKSDCASAANNRGHLLEAGPVMSARERPDTVHPPRVLRHSTCSCNIKTQETSQPRDDLRSFLLTVLNAGTHCDLAFVPFRIRDPMVFGKPGQVKGFGNATFPGLERSWNFLSKVIKKSHDIWLWLLHSFLFYSNVV